MTIVVYPDEDLDQMRDQLLDQLRDQPPEQPLEVKPKRTRMKGKFTVETFAQIAQWVEQNVLPDEIAFRIGCKVTTLKTKCCQARVSLRTPNWKDRRQETYNARGMSTPQVIATVRATPPKPVELPMLAPVANVEMPKPLPVKKAVKRFVIESTLPLSRVALSLLRQKAEAVGKTECEYVTELLETIARDELFDAVLDNKAA